MSDRLSLARRENEPTAAPNPNSLRFVISRAGPQNWVLVESHGLYGGVFVSKDAAIHFADLESRDREATFEIIADEIERLERKNGKLHTHH